MKKQSIKCAAANSDSGGRGKPFVPDVKLSASVGNASWMCWGMFSQAISRTNDSTLRNGIVMHCLASNSGSGGRGKTFVPVVRRQVVTNA